MFNNVTKTDIGDVNLSIIIGHCTKLMSLV